MNQHQYNQMFNLALTTKSRIDTQKFNLQQLTQRRQNELNNMKSLQENHTLYEESIDILKGLISKLSRHHIEHLEKLINTSVKTIFLDRKYTIEFEITEYRNTNNLQLTLLDETTGEPIRSDLNSNGYGLKAIIGFILQVYFILYYHQAPVMFLDEAFSNLSQQYLPYLRALINDLRDKYEFIFVLITHDPRLKEIADKTYEVSMGDVKLLEV